jgi:hypothetical protein
MSTTSRAAGRRHFTRSFLGWSALARVGVVCAVLVVLWLMVAWAVALP